MIRKLKSVRVEARVVLERADPIEFRPIERPDEPHWWVPDYMTITWLDDALFSIDLSGFILKRDSTPGTRRYKVTTAHPGKMPDWAVAIAEDLVEQREVRLR